MTDYEKLADQINDGDAEYEVLFRIPASEDYPWGDEVGFVKSEGWLFAVDFHLCGSPTPKFAIEPDSTAYFPAATKWMITNNDAINHGLQE